MVTPKIFSDIHTPIPRISKYGEVSASSSTSSAAQPHTSQTLATPDNQPRNPIPVQSQQNSDSPSAPTSQPNIPTPVATDEPTDKEKKEDVALTKSLKFPKDLNYFIFINKITDSGIKHFILKKYSELVKINSEFEKQV
jgi:hypothetical protein